MVKLELEWKAEAEQDIFTVDRLLTLILNLIQLLEEQVVYVEKNEISNNFEIDHEYEFYGIFLTSPSIDQFNDSICDATVSPISEYAFNVLRGSIESRNDFEHAFAVNNN